MWDCVPACVEQAGSNQSGQDVLLSQTLNMQSNEQQKFSCLDTNVSAARDWSTSVFAYHLTCGPLQPSFVSEVTAPGRSALDSVEVAYGRQVGPR